jgi:hypothetical protein
MLTREDLKKTNFFEEGELLDFLYSVTGLVICGDSVWMWMAAGELDVVCLSGDAGSGSFAV